MSTRVPLAASGGSIDGPCAAVLGVLVDAGPVGLAPGELSCRVELPETTRRWAVRRLIERGYATRQGQHGRIRATDAARHVRLDSVQPARAAAAPASPTTGPRPQASGTVADLDRAIGHLPTEAHRAAFRLMLDAVIARWHLRDAEPSGWPSFVLAGPTKSGKTLLGLGACQLFGLDSALVVRSLPTETERSLWGRRHQLPGGAWALRSAPVLDLPLLVLDEADKATTDVRRASLRLLQGETRVAGEEGEVVTIAPVVLVTANGGADVVPDEYRRRSVVLDMTSLVDQLDDLHRRAPAFLDALPVLDLDAFEVPALAASVLGDLVPQLRAGLSERGWRLVDERALAHLVAGRVALRGCDLPTAVALVAGDYLDTAETVGETPAPGPVEPAPAAAERRRTAEAEQARQRDARRRERAEDIELRGLAGHFVDGLRQVRPDPASFDPPHRAPAALVAGRIDALIDQAEEADSLDELHEVAEDGRRVVEEATALASHRRAELPMHRQVIDVETVDENDEGWWQCHACLRDFDEPDERGWLRRTVCPYCESVDIEWIDTEDEEDGDKLGALEPAPAGPWCCPYCEARFADGQIDATRPWCPSCRTFGVIAEPESGPRTQWLPLPPMLPSGPRTR